MSASLLPDLGVPLGKASRRTVALTYPDARTLDVQTLPFDDETIVYLLGLMISKRIVRDHGGTIGAESSVGVGTTFTIRLPRLERRVRELPK